MIRIGILTFYYKNYNYGGILQTYALEHFLNSCFHNVRAEQIYYDRTRVPLSLFDRTIRFLCRGDIKRKFVKYSAKRALSTSNYSAIDKFASDAIIHNERVYDGDNYRDIGAEYDILICGSDQVWNPIAVRDAYFFKGINKKKLSYAASIAAGDLKWPERIKYKKALSSFSAISVREESARKQLVGLIDKKIATVLDPVLLLTKDDWNAVATDRIISKPYMFTYFLGSVRAKEKNGTERLTEKKIVSVEGLAFGSENEEILSGVGPGEFLSLIKYADEIWTDSFHALVFSIIFERPFRVFSREGEAVDMSERIRDILNMLELKPESQESYRNAKRILEEKREESIVFLKDAIY